LTQTVADAGDDLTSLSLIYSNRTPYDIILDEDLTEYEKMGKLFYFPVVQSPDENWQLAEGYITEKMIESFMPPDSDESLIIICGPPKLKDSVKELLDNMEYKNYFLFN